MYRIFRAALAALLAFSGHAAARDHLVIVFQKQKDPAALQASATRLGELLGAELGQRVEVRVPLDYSASVQALVSGQADAAYISSLPFLLARRDGSAELLLVEERRDARGVARTDYDSIFVVRADSPLNDFDDLKRDASTLRMAFTSPTSTSGYVFPLKRFVAEGMIPAGDDGRGAFREVRFGGGYPQALQEVLAGRADVAAVSDYVLEGPAADTYLSATERGRLRILARTPGVPTHLLAVRGGLDATTKARLKSALLAIAAREPGLVRDVYGASGFVEADEDAHVRAAIEAIEASGLPIENLAR